MEKRVLMEEHFEALRRGLAVTEIVTRNRDDCGALPLILNITRRLSEATITDEEAIIELAALVADGTIDPRLLGRLGDHPTLVKAVAEKLLAQSIVES